MGLTKQIISTDILLLHNLVSHSIDCTKFNFFLLSPPNIDD